MELDSSQQLQELMNSIPGNEKDQDYNPLSQSKSCHDLKMLLNFEIDQINPTDDIENPNNFVRNISSGEGCISSKS